jgi:uncharacterized membrane protein YoaK (UPF0700 family)
VLAQFPAEGVRRRHYLVLLLTANSGATDAIGFLALGGSFTSVMTGNIVLLGTASARADVRLAGHVTAAIICYVAGCSIGAKLAGTPHADDRIWPAPVRRALVIEFYAFAIYALVWWATQGKPSSAIQLALLAINAVALGIQSSAVQRFGVSGLSTTYFTGTLTTLVVRLASRDNNRREVADSIRQLIALLSGAAIAGLLVSHVQIVVPVIQLALVATVLLGSRRIGQLPSVISPPRIEAVQS